MYPQGSMYHCQWEPTFAIGVQAPFFSPRRSSRQRPETHLAGCAVLPAGDAYQAGGARQRPPVPQSGDYAPRYAKGGKGSCINNKSCRGFGVRADDGSAVYTCFGRDGGCAGGQRCDFMHGACVPENAPLLAGQSRLAGSAGSRDSRNSDRANDLPKGTGI